jgi:FlaA1/EpsC-like NDP-sugar epimerase
MESFSSKSKGEKAAAAPSPVTAFYRDKAVLITGATGFMGKVGR